MAGILVGHLRGDLQGDLRGGWWGGWWGGFPGDFGGAALCRLRQLPHFRVGPECHRDEVARLERGFWAVHSLRAITDAADAGAGLLNEVDALQQVGDKRVPPNAPVAEIGQGHALRQRAGADYLNAVGVQFHEDVGAVEEPVAVHHRVGDRFAQCLHRILGDVLASQALDSISGAGVAFDEAHGVLNVRHDAAVEVLTVQDVNLVRATPKEASDVRLGEEVLHVLGEEQYAGVAEQQPVAGRLRHFYVHQHVLHRSGRDAGKPQPGVELVVVKILRVVEARAW